MMSEIRQHTSVLNIVQEANEMNLNKADEEPVSRDNIEENPRGIDELVNKEQSVEPKQSNETTNFVFLDHQYLASWNDSSNSDFSDEDDDDYTEENLQYELAFKARQANRPHNFQGHLRSILTGSTEFTRKMMENAMKNLVNTNSEPEDLTQSIPNADDIQKHFQDTMTMASFLPISDLESGNENVTSKPKHKKSKDAQRHGSIILYNFLTKARSSIEVLSEKIDAIKKLVEIRSNKETVPSSANETMQSSQEQQCSDNVNARKSVSMPVSCNRTVDYHEWVKIRRDTRDEVEFNSLLAHAMSLMVKKWAEYLSFSVDEMQKFELENARNQNMCDEVIEMLEDRDRYVWQLIEEL